MSASPLPSELLRAAGAVKDRVLAGPESIYLDIEHRCNLSCCYCRVHSLRKAGRGRTSPARVTTKKLLGLIDQAAAWQCREMILTGHGEPTLSPAFKPVAGKILEKGIPLVLYTNGTFPPSLLPLVSKASQVIINFSAPDQETFDNYIAPGSARLFPRICRNIRLLAALARSRKTPQLELSFIITRENHQHMAAALGFAKRYGVPRVIFSHMMPAPDTKGLSLRKADMPGLRKSVAQALCAGKGINHNLSEISGAPRESALPKGTQCMTGWYNLVIAGNGDATICCRHEAPVIGSLSLKTGKELWESARAQEIRMRYKYGLSAHALPFKGTCSCCRWVRSFSGRMARLTRSLRKIPGGNDVP